MLPFLPIYFYFIVISFLTSIYVYINPDKTYGYLKFFPPFLLASLVVEAYAPYLAFTGKPNIWIYNFFTVIEFSFYLWIINFFISNKRVRKGIKVSTIIYKIIAIINIIFVQKINSFHSVTYSLGCLLIVAACVYYFFELLKFPRSVKLTQIPSFWICSGLLFYYCCSFPLFGFANLIASISKLIVTNLHNIIIILNIFLYTLFTIAFLCRVKIRKYT